MNIHDEGKEFQKDMTFFVDDQEIALRAVLREDPHFGDMVEFLRGSLGAFCRDQVAPPRTTRMKPLTWKISERSVSWGFWRWPTQSLTGGWG